MAKNPTVQLLGQAVFDPSYESSHFLTTPDAVALKSQFLGGNNNVYFLWSKQQLTLSLVLYLQLSIYFTTASQMSQMNGEP